MRISQTLALAASLLGAGVLPVGRAYSRERSKTVDGRDDERIEAAKAKRARKAAKRAAENKS